MEWVRERKKSSKNGILSHTHDSGEKLSSIFEFKFAWHYHFRLPHDSFVDVNVTMSIHSQRMWRRNSHLTRRKAESLCCSTYLRVSVRESVVGICHWASWQIGSIQLIRFSILPRLGHEKFSIHHKLQFTRFFSLAFKTFDCICFYYIRTKNRIRMKTFNNTSSFWYNPK